MNNLRRSLKSGGHFILATFAEDGPLKCSGLDVQRYSLDELRQTLGAEFTLLRTFDEQHRTPFDTNQNFLYAHFQLEEDSA